ncbi:hypothetical protein MKD33_00970, partial [Chromobacterium piscinae]
PLEIGAALL